MIEMWNKSAYNIDVICECGKTALYRVGERGYCAAHRVQAQTRIQTFGNPRARKTPARPSMVRVVEVVKKSARQVKIERQQRMKANPTPAESKLRDILRQCAETKGKYEFQPIVNGYIPDFLYRRAKLILEADGWRHSTTAGKRADARRTAHFRRDGFDVLRLTNEEILQRPPDTLEKVIVAQRARLNPNVRPGKR